MPVERYLAALEHMRQMPRHSTRDGIFLPSQAETDLAGSKADPSRALANPWTQLGPATFGGRTRAILIHPTTPTTMWAAGVAGGVWKTTNGGASWTALADMMANLAVNSMAMDPANPNVIYAGTGEGYFNEDSVRGAGIFKTTDGGTSWSQLATRAGVFRSDDGGANWGMASHWWAATTSVRRRRVPRIGTRTPLRRPRRSPRPAGAFVRHDEAWLRMPSVLVLTTLILAGLVGVRSACAAPVIPNESLVAAEVLELTAIHSSALNIRPPQMLVRLKLRLLSVQEVPPRANFLEGKKGETLEVYSKEVLPSGLVGKVIKARIVFRGDERGGLYWISRVVDAQPP